MHSSPISTTARHLALMSGPKLAAGTQKPAVGQLVIEQEFRKAEIRSRTTTSPARVIRIIHRRPDVARWCACALEQKVIWCQLFSEPDAAPACRGCQDSGQHGLTVDVISGQKVWTSGRT
jgi:alkylation response protein AidB-like acyl-CoA dehydrogenase